MIDVDSPSGLRTELTLPAEWYTSQEVLEAERTAIFRRTWQYVGHAVDVEEPGQYMTAVVGGVPVVVVRDKDHSLNAFVNVCRHRAHLVVEGRGRRTSLQCPYHAWTFGLDGRLRAAPRSEQEPGFDKSELGLVPIRVETWGPLVLVNLSNDAPGLHEAIAPLTTAVEEAGGTLEGLRPGHRAEFNIRGNWKVVAENYLECYHCAVAHPGYAKFCDVSSDGYRFEMVDGVFLGDAALRPELQTNAEARPYDMSGPVHKNRIDYFWPNLAVMLWPGQPNLVIYSFTPVSPTETVGAFEYFFHEDMPEATRADLTTFLDAIGEEDVPLVESVQRGLDSGIQRYGRLLRDEGQIAYFQDLVRAALAESHGDRTY